MKLMTANEILAVNVFIEFFSKKHTKNLEPVWQELWFFVEYSVLLKRQPSWIGK